MEEYNYIRKSNVKKHKGSSNKNYKNTKIYRDNSTYAKNRAHNNSINYRDDAEYKTKSSTASKNKKNNKHRAKHSNNRYKCQTKKLNKKKVAIVIAIPLIILFIVINKNSKKDGQDVEQVSANNPNRNIEVKNENTNSTSTTELPNAGNISSQSTGNTLGQSTEKTTSTNTGSTSGQNTNNTSSTSDWRIRLANYNHQLPEDFEVELADIDSTRQFDARAIKYLKDMLNDMREDGNTNIWVQSSYRSVKRQKELYDNSIQKYLKQGKSEEEAIKLTDEYINRPGCSDHNLGLAVDFNYVDNSFEDTKEFKWLQENAENYGFILRYPKDKEDITTIAYESWHWRYVGEEHAKKINELNMCLEEYVEYLENG